MKTMHRYIFPSLPAVLRVFFLLGPLLLFVALVVNLNIEQTVQPPAMAKSSSLMETLAASLYLLMFSVLTGLLWFAMSFAKDTWAITWVPMALSATAYWFIMRSICNRPIAKFRSRVHWVVINSVACSGISVTVFFVDVAILSRLFWPLVISCGTQHAQ